MCVEKSYVEGTHYQRSEFEFPKIETSSDSEWVRECGVLLDYWLCLNVELTKR